MVRQDNLTKIVINFANNKENIIKTAKYVAENVKFVYFCVKNDKIELIVDSSFADDIERQIAQLNNLIEE